MWFCHCCCFLHNCKSHLNKCHKCYVVIDIMGVKDLWTILEPVKQHKRLTELQGQVIAVDLSIWIVEAKTLQLKGVAKPHLRFYEYFHIYLLALLTKMNANYTAYHLQFNQKSFSYCHFSYCHWTRFVFFLLVKGNFAKMHQCMISSKGLKKVWRVCAVVED